MMSTEHNSSSNEYFLKEKNRTLFGVGCNAVVFNKNKHVLLLRRAKNVVYSASCWDLPGGQLGNKENPFDAIKREIEEETSLKAMIIKLFDVEIINKTGCKVDVLSMKFLATTASTNVCLSIEHIDYCWASINRLPNDLNKGLTLLILKAFNLLNELNC